jgi:glycogen debranching enzyme
MPEEILLVDDQYYILATSTRGNDRPRVIKQDETFAVFDHAGSMRPVGLGEQGIFHEGTRHLSRFELVVAGRKLQALRSTVRNDQVLVVELTNPDYPDLDDPLPRDSIHVELRSFLQAGSWYARMTMKNYALRPIELPIVVRFAADFFDIFEVRGAKRARRGKLRPPALAGGAVSLSYDGLDGVTRTTRLAFSPAPRELTGAEAAFDVELQPNESRAIDLVVTCAKGADPSSFATALEKNNEVRDARETGATLEASNHRYRDWLERSACDLRMMTTATEHGLYPFAGVPWYSAAFGRDGMTTAFQRLWLDPALAHGVLNYLAATQATAFEPERDAEPGKIVHEVRLGEMAALGEIPFGRYYGSVDTTPLFVALAGAYYRRTADLDTIDGIWPNVERALAWIDTYGDRDGDGFVEYARRTPRGLASQGWKDSADSISHADGRLAEGPIALAEVQGYVYAAFRATASLLRARGDDDRALVFDARADKLRAEFDRVFWSPELGTYHLALDGAKRPCAVRASNAGHALFTGIALRERATSVCDALMGPHSFSGWGIRTLDEREVRYNPMSYHNGSVWPHDNAIAALGMARYGFKREALEVLDASYRAHLHFEMHRMPELFCGFARQSDDAPTPYPVACAPQSWSAGAVFMLLQAVLGIDVDAPRRRIRIVHPMFPENLDRLAIRGLVVGAATVDLVLQRHDPQRSHVAVYLDGCEGEVEVVSVPRGH